MAHSNKNSGQSAPPLFQTGDVFLTSRKGLWANIVQTFTQNKFHHCGIHNGSMVQEAISKGFVECYGPYGWLENEIKKGATVKVLRKKEITKTEMTLIINRCDWHRGTAYDFWSLLFFQPIFQLTGLWFGKKQNGFVSTLYCSEAVALCYPELFAKPWLIAPSHIEENPNFEVIYYHNPRPTHI